ncbi:MAG: sulfatase-like hydrolase/transferase, partial [Muribaculaceae bacterium]|nr:sulfatase-like hydrolase/transferase [Muribaculaceae bacterium]
NKMLAYRNYGYDRIYNSDSIAAHTPEGMSRDGAMFRYALELIDSIGEPVHMQLLTIQMHAPFNEPVRNFTNYAGMGLSRDERRYINCTADFDRGLGYFVKGLQDRGMWENTVLVIASDHNRPGSKTADGRDADIVFIAANACERGQGIHVDDEVHQIDVFPTVLDIMGAPAGTWRGVGHSMVGPRRGQSHPRQHSASDSLLRSDFFK